MARVKPETLYAPLAPLIADARKRGLSDDEILDRLERAKGAARQAGYTGREIMDLHSPEITPESRPKSFLRGVVEGLTLGFYVPERLKQQPNEIEQGIPLGVGELSPSGAGEFIGSTVPFTGALRATRPIAGAIAGRVLGAGRAARVGAEALNVGGASGLMEGVRTGDPMAALEAGGIGAAFGGAYGLGRQIIAARRASRVPPSAVVEAEPSAAPAAPPAVERPAGIREFQEPAQRIEGRRGIPRETEMLVRPRVEEPPRPLPTARERALTRAGVDVTQPAERPGRIVGPSGKPVLYDRAGRPVGETAESPDMAAVRQVAAQAEADAAKLHASKQAPPLPSSETPPEAPALTPPSGQFRLRVQYGGKSFAYERGTEAEIDSLRGTIQETVSPTVARQMTFTTERVSGPARRGAVRPPIAEPTEIPSGLTPKRGAAPEVVRLPEDVNIPSVAEQLDRKGLVFRVDRSVKERPFVIVEPGGSVKRFQRLADAVGYADSLSDDVRATTMGKAIRGQPLSAAEQRNIVGARGRRKVATQPVDVNTDVQPQGPPEPPPVPPPQTLGGPGAQLNLPGWVEHVTRLRGLQGKEAQRFATSVTQLVTENPELGPALADSFAAPNGKFVSWSPGDYVAQPQAARNPLIAKAAGEAAEVEMAHDFETRRWVEYYNKHFAGLNNEEAAQTARVIEGELPPGSVSARVRDAVAAWKTAAEDFAKRIGVPEWGEYLTRLTDMQAVYESWRPTLLDARRFSDLSDTMQFKIGSERVFNTMKRAFEKQATWDALPRDVKQWTRDRLLNWDVGTKWEALPEAVRSRIPKEIFDRFLLPRTGGLPYLHDVRASFQAYVPAALRKLHLDPLLDRWEPIVNNLPGRHSHPLSEGFYLSRYLTQFSGRESVGLDKVADGVVRNIENSVGKALADPRVASRLATRLAGWGYRGTLGIDTAFVNATQSMNTWAASGSSGFLRGLSRFIAGEGKSRPDVGMLREFSELYGFKPSPGLGRAATQRLAEWDDKLTRLVLSPMSLAENLNRGIAFLSGMEEAAALGLDTTRAVQLGFAKSSQVVPNLALTKAQLNGIDRVAQTQFVYSTAYRNPYLAGPLARISTMFWSYPVRQTQFLVNGMADGINAVLKSPNLENSSRLLRFTALTGLFAGGAALGAKVGLDVSRVFGLQGLFPRGAGPLLSVPWEMLTNAYNAVTGQKPVTDKDVRRMWSDAAKILVPFSRHGAQLAEIPGNIERGYRIDDLGRETYRTTPFGEFTHAIGFEAGDSYRERVLYLTVRAEESKRQDARRYALSQAIDGEMAAADAYNEAYPEMPLTERDLRAELKLRERPLIERGVPLYQRRRIAEELEPDESETLTP